MSLSMSSASLSFSAPHKDSSSFFTSSQRFRSADFFFIFPNLTERLLSLASILSRVLSSPGMGRTKHLKLIKG
ncbi:MAG: hypothetical protein WC483_02900 [Candidatus Paceibacterota bacterium]